MSPAHKSPLMTRATRFPPNNGHDIPGLGLFCAWWRQRARSEVAHTGDVGVIRPITQRSKTCPANLSFQIRSQQYVRSQICNCILPP